jgi:cytochrome P450
VRSEIDGRPLTDDEIVGITILLYSAGLDTVVNSLGFIFRFLAENPDLQALLRADSKAIPRHVEEMMRLFSPVTPQRIAVQDTELGGVQIKAGDLVTVSLAAASRDPEDIPDPARFDPQRNPNPHFGFGYGVHRCVGAQLARRDISIAIEEWLKRIPDFRIAPDAQIKAVGGSVLALDQLPLVW